MNNTPDWIIRQCPRHEIPAVLDLWRESETTVSMTDSAEDLHRATKEASAFLLVAEAEGRLVGTVTGTFDGWRGNLYRLAVHPSYRRRGIARALVQEAETQLAQQGAKGITALVEKDHPWATGFWAAVEYERDTRIVRYVKSLPPNQE